MADEERAKPSHAARRQERYRQAALKEAGLTKATMQSTATDENLQMGNKLLELSTCMEEMKLDFSKRISALEDRIQDFESKLKCADNLRNYLSPIRRQDVDDIAERLNRLETLLFSVPDMRKLDNAIRQLLQVHCLG